MRDAGELGPALIGRALRSKTDREPCHLRQASVLDMAGERRRNHWLFQNVHNRGGRKKRSGGMIANDNMTDHFQREWIMAHYSAFCGPVPGA